MTTLKELSLSTFNDVLACFGLPADTATMLFRNFMDQQIEAGRDELLKAMAASALLRPRSTSRAAIGSTPSRSSKRQFAASRRAFARETVCSAPRPMALDLP